MSRGAFPRIECSVPGCRRGTTTAEPGQEIMCGGHWRMIQKRLRALTRGRAKALEAFMFWWDHYDPDAPVSPGYLRRAIRARDAYHRAWDRCVRAAAERSAGLS